MAFTSKVLPPNRKPQRWGMEETYQNLFHLTCWENPVSVCAFFAWFFTWFSEYPHYFLLFTLLLSSFVETRNSHLASVCQFWYPGVFLAILVSLLLVAAFIDLVWQIEKGFYSFLPERTPTKCHHYLSSLWLHKVTQSCEG